jgi:aspartyl-tRNA(Asn)/glutamyl-tRNA(Gln) amidotransferase subunit A
MTITGHDDAATIAAAVRRGEVSALAVTEASLRRIAALNPPLNAFTAVTASRALERAARVDAVVAQGLDPGPLAGVPFGVKNLFDVVGLATLAGSKINRAHPAATEDAFLIRRLEAAGAVLVGAQNMGEYAYDFTGMNAHDGPSRNPHDPARMAGGSSGGSATAVASGMVPLSLGSDTNGSIRVPASLCGLFGLKPTYGRLSRGGTFPFVASLDHLGPLARSVTDLALAYDAMIGPDANDPAQTRAVAAPVLGQIGDGIDGLRIMRAGGYFSTQQMPEATHALDLVAHSLSAGTGLILDGVTEARAAAYLITMTEAAALHLNRLRERAGDFDPDVRDRLIAGAMVPAAWVTKAQKFRAVFAAQMRQVFQSVDVILAPATPCSAPLIGQRDFVLDGVTMPLRPSMGIFTQPISFIGLPVVAVPVWPQGHGMPVAVQVITAAGREDLALRVARYLEQAGVAKAPVAQGMTV